MGYSQELRAEIQGHASENKMQDIYANEFEQEIKDKCVLIIVELLGR